MNDSQPPTFLLDKGESIPISGLNPDASDQENRVVHGEITVAWPFSIITKSIAFLLAEGDFRVRVQFHGAAAKAISDASLGAGDKIRVSLKGVQWEKNETKTQTAGSTLAWQLEFTNRLVIAIRPYNMEQETLLDIDAPAVEPETAADGQAENTDPIDIDTIPEGPATPDPPSPEPIVPAKRSAASALGEFEYASPAFLKRARVSFGSLFEGGFDEDISKKTKPKKRSRFSMPGNAWRYTSQSPSPGPDDVPEESEEEETQVNGNPQPNDDIEDTHMDTPSRPAMVDQGSQTADVDFTPMASVQVLAESRPSFGFTQMTPTPFARTKPFGADNPAIDQSLNFGDDSTTPHSIPPESHQNPFSQQPNPMDTNMTFSFTPQTVLFPQAPAFFSGQDDVPDSPSRVTGVEDYPAALLDANSTSSNPVDTLMGFASHASQPVAAPQHPFSSESALDSAFATAAPSQNPWAAEELPGSRSANASSDTENPVQILSSSPSRQELRDSTEDRQVSPSRENTEMNVTADASPEPTLEDPASEAEYYRDGGDEPGDDYDLRKYSRTHDDDDDIETSEEERDENDDNPGAQIMNPEEDDMDVDQDVANQEKYSGDVSEEYEEEMYEERFEGDGQSYEESEDDAEGEYYSDEDGYTDDEEEEEEEEAQTRLRAAPIPREPVFIDLLSDSEDENEPAPKLVPEPEPKGEPKEDLEEEVKHESDSESEDEVGASPKNAQDTTPSPVPEGKEEAENLEADEEMTEQAQSPSEAAEPSTLTTKEMNEDTETKHVTKEETTQVEKSSVPMPPARNDSSPDRNEDPGASTISEEIKTRDDSSHIEKSAENQESSAASHDMEMGAPTLTVVSDKPEDAAITIKETTRIDSLDETAPTVAEETAEAMDVDAALDAPLEDTVERLETEKVEVVENSVTVNEEVQTTITNAQNETSTSVQVTAAQEESLIQLQETSEDNAAPSNINSTGGLSSEGDAEVDETQEFHDAMMQDEPSENATGKSAINTVVVEDAEEHPIKDGRISPPPTQISQVQTLQDTINVAVHDHDQHLPTPGETQVIEVDMSDILQTVTYDGQTDEEDTNPEDQIMAEILQHSPVKQDAHLPMESVAFPPAASQTNTFTRTEQADETHEGPASQSEPAPVAAVAKSLRPRRSKPNRASDDSDQEDPSIALIAAAPATGPADSGSKHSNSVPTGPSSKTRSKTRNKTHDDPSIQLAGGFRQSETKNKRKRKAADDESITSLDNSPSGAQRVLGSMTDHDDPSILLVKGSSPPARQTRRHKTPDLKHETPRRETRSVSRSLRLQDSPDASFASLISPSIAGSFATVPEDGEEDVKSLKLRLVKNLRTDLPDFLPLKSLRGNIDKITDVLAVVTQTPPQPQPQKHGRLRRFMLTLTLTDPSTAPNQVRVANIFGTYLTSLPEVESGDIILLRRVKVVAMTGRNFGVRSEDLSSWAVSKPNDEQVLSQVKGLPVEITTEEIEHAKGLRQWWSLQDDNAMNKIRKVTEGKENAK
ncbi:hypothetical protein FVEN_g10440 [Fusarium venenatum]|uniref:Telomeric single stranded DNA binding POT1/Cdc13 domain-containing protein n=1 Tax=Fusarium venenatum TaxID=56646 RepID=A0A2L2T050_9HYPO|nr:uncharacterized protein FVRRES_11984 [Fusarium venenatum]KAG8351472.1 hypothetical protein FVEN_g10440 [Fusarium venenatum]CEI39293.1 unnamed protein product [Fusarium venenatum]